MKPRLGSTAHITVIAALHKAAHDFTKAQNDSRDKTLGWQVFGDPPNADKIRAKLAANIDKSAERLSRAAIKYADFMKKAVL